MQVFITGLLLFNFFYRARFFASDFEIDVHASHWSEIHIGNLNAVNTFRLA